MKGLAVQVLPGEGIPIPEEIAVRAIFLGKRCRAGIQVIVILAEGLPGRDMGMAVEQNVTRPHGRQGGYVVAVAMGRIDEAAALSQDGIGGHDGEFQYHLVYIGVTISTDTEDGIFDFVEHGKDFLRGIVFGQVIARPVIEDIAEQDQAVSPFPLPGVEHTAAVISRTVNI